MRLEKASTKAIKYAIMNFHYSKSVPMVQSAFSVFNDDDEWCGVICYAIGANNVLAKSFGLPNGAVAELVRVALNGKQGTTSKAVSISMRIIKKHSPLIRLLVSYADTEQGHEGIIYQASNWIYCGNSQAADEYMFQGKRWHGRSFRSSHGSHTQYTEKELQIISGSVKLKYIYPLDKSLIPMCKKLSKPYPKKQSAVIV